MPHLRRKSHRRQDRQATGEDRHGPARTRNTECRTSIRLQERKLSLPVPLTLSEEGRAANPLAHEEGSRCAGCWRAWHHGHGRRHQVAQADQVGPCVSALVSRRAIYPDRPLHRHQARGEPQHAMGRELQGRLVRPRSSRHVWARRRRGGHKQAQSAGANPRHPLMPHLLRWRRLTMIGPVEYAGRLITKERKGWDRAQPARRARRRCNAACAEAHLHHLDAAEPCADLGGRRLRRHL